MLIIHLDKKKRNFHCFSARNYSDWEKSITCSFKNVFTEEIALFVGDNVQSIAGVKHFKTQAMAKQVPSTYDFRCDRREANSIRDKLASITTRRYSHIWFTIDQDPFHYIYDRRSMLTSHPNQIKDCSLVCHFGAMSSYSTFKQHGEKHPLIRQLRMTKRRDQVETIHIVSRDESEEI